MSLLIWRNVSEDVLESSGFVEIGEGVWYHVFVGEEVGGREGLFAQFSREVVSGISVCWAGEDEVADVLGDVSADRLWTVRRVRPSDCVEVLIEGDVSCSELCQYASLSAIEFTGDLKIFVRGEGGVDVFHPLVSWRFSPPRLDLFLGLRVDRLLDRCNADW